MFFEIFRSDKISDFEVSLMDKIIDQVLTYAHHISFDRF